MDRSEMVYLIDEKLGQDSYGVTTRTPVRTPIFCRVDSVTASEFFDGGRNGLNPEYRITMFYADYHGERIVEYMGQTYSIYRTYRAKTDVLELYVERKGGTNGKNH